MRKISGNVVSTKVSTLARAAEIVSRFAAVDNGSSPAVSLYLHRTADAFNHLLHFHDKRRKLESSPIAAEKSLAENKATKKDKKISDETNLKGNEVSEVRVRKKDKKTFDNLRDTNLKGDEVEDVEISMKKKKRKSGDGDMKEKSSKKKKSKEAVEDNVDF